MSVFLHPAQIHPWVGKGAKLSWRREGSAISNSASRTCKRTPPSTTCHVTGEGVNWHVTWVSTVLHTKSSINPCGPRSNVICRRSDPSIRDALFQHVQLRPRNILHRRSKQRSLLGWEHTPSYAATSVVLPRRAVESWSGWGNAKAASIQTQRGDATARWGSTTHSMCPHPQRPSQRVL